MQLDTKDPNLLLFLSLSLLVYGSIAVFTKRSLVGSARLEAKGKLAVLYGIVLIIGGLLFLYGYFTPK